MLVGRVVADQLGDHAQPALVRLSHQPAHVAHRPVGRVDVVVVGDVVAVVLAGARVERQEPQRVDAEILEIVELLGQAGEIADAVAV